MTYVGQVYVRVSPDTKQFDAAMARREKQKRKTVFQALLDTAEAEARRKVLERPATFRLEVDAKTEEIDEAKARIDALKKSMDGFNDADTELEIEVETRKIEELTKDIARIEAMTKEDYVIELDTRIDNATTNIKEVKTRIQDLKTQSKIEIRAEVSAARAKIENMRDALAEMKREADVPVRLEIAKAQADISRLKAELRRVKDDDKKIKLEADLSQAMADLVAWQNRAGKTITPEIEVQMEGIAKAEAELRTLARDRRVEVSAELSLEEASLAEYKLELQKLTADKKITANLDVDAKAARAQLAVVSRDRMVNLYVAVFGLKKASDALKGLSGMGMVSGFRDSMFKMAASLDKVAISLSTVVPLIAHLSSLLITAVPAIAAVGEGFGMLPPALLPLVGGFAALSATIVVTAMAFRGLKDASDASAKAFYQSWQKAGDQMDKVKKTIQENFFTADTSKIFDSMIKTTIPQLESGFGKLAASLGTIFEVVVRQLDVGLGKGVLSDFLANTTTAADNATQGFTDMTQGLINLIDIGGSYLPEFGTWISEIGEKFWKWSDDTDAVKDSIEQAHTQLGLLGDGIAGFFGSFGAILDATGAATDGFQGFADAMTTFEAFLRTSELQAGMGGLFRGAAAGIAGLSAAVGDMKVELQAALIYVGWILESFGGAFEALVKGIITTLATPEMVVGMTALGDSIKAALESIDWNAVGVAIGSIASALAPVMPLLAELFNKLVSMVPMLAKMAGGIAEFFIPIITAIAPLLPALFLIGGALISIVKTALALDPLIKMFGGWGATAGKVSGALGGVGRAFGGIGGAISKVVAMIGPLFTNLLTIAGRVFGGIGGAISKVVAMIGPLFTNLLTIAGRVFGGIGGAVGKLVGAFGRLGPVLSKVTTGVRLFGAVLLANPIGIVIAAIVALIAAFVYFYKTNEDFRDSVTNAWNKVKEVVAIVVLWFVQEVLPKIMAVSTAIADGFRLMGDIIAMAIAVLLIPFQMFVTWVTDTAYPELVSFFDNLGAKWDAGVAFIIDIFTRIHDFIMGWVEKIRAFFDRVSEAWDKLMGKNTDLATNTEANFAAMEASVAGHTNTMSLVASANMATMSTNVTGSMGGMAASSASILSGWAANAGSRGSEAGSGVATGVSKGMANALAAVNGFEASFDAATSDWYTKGYNAGFAMGDGVIKGLESRIAAAAATALRLAAATSAYLPGSPAKLGPYSGHGWTPYRGKALVDGFVEGMLQTAPKLADASRFVMKQSSDALNMGASDVATWSGLVAQQVGVGGGVGAGVAPVNITVSPILDPAKSMQSQTQRSMEAAFEAADRRLLYA